MIPHSCSINEGMPTRKERIRALNTHFRLALSWAARGGDAVCGKLVNEVVGITEVINDMYAGPRPMLPKSGCKSTTVGTSCDCRRAQHWTSSLDSRSLSLCLAEASRMPPGTSPDPFTVLLNPSRRVFCKPLPSHHLKATCGSVSTSRFLRFSGFRLGRFRRPRVSAQHPGVRGHL